jgi:hypothetical protein
VLGGQKCVAGEARCGGRGGRIFPAPLTRWSRISSPRISLCPACSERPLCSGDELEAPNNVLDRAGQKENLGTRLKMFFYPTRLNPFRGRFGGRRWRCSNNARVPDEVSSLI